MNTTDTSPPEFKSQTVTAQTYRMPFAIMTTLFFMWGFMTVWNDILIPRFKEAFTLDYFHAMLIQFAWMGGYTVGSLIYPTFRACFWHFRLIYFFVTFS